MFTFRVYWFFLRLNVKWYYLAIQIWRKHYIFMDLSQRKALSDIAQLISQTQYEISLFSLLNGYWMVLIGDWMVTGKVAFSRIFSHYSVTIHSTELREYFSKVILWKIKSDPTRFGPGMYESNGNYAFHSDERPIFFTNFLNSLFISAQIAQLKKKVKSDETLPYLSKYQSSWNEVT